jgi:hypothetical protein
MNLQEQLDNAIVNIGNQTFLVPATEWAGNYELGLPIAKVNGIPAFLKFNFNPKDKNYGWNLCSFDNGQPLNNRMVPLGLKGEVEDDVFPEEKHVPQVLGAMLAISRSYRKTDETLHRKLENFALFGKIDPGKGDKPIRRFTRRGNPLPIR